MANQPRHLPPDGPPSLDPVHQTPLSAFLDCHPSWENRVINTMEREHPGLLRHILHLAIADNASERARSAS